MIRYSNVTMMLHAIVTIALPKLHQNWYIATYHHDVMYECIVSAECISTVYECKEYVNTAPQLRTRITSSSDIPVVSGTALLLSIKSAF